MCVVCIMRFTKVSNMKTELYIPNTQETNTIRFYTSA